MKKLIITLLTIVLASQLFARQMNFTERRNSSTDYERKQRRVGNVFQQTYKRFDREKIPVRKNVALSVFNENGNVKIIGWDKDYMLVESKSVSYGNKYDLNSVELSITEMEGYVIQTKLPSKSQVKVHLKIYVPKDMKLDNIESINDSVTIKDVNKSMDTDTHLSKR